MNSFVCPVASCFRRSIYTSAVCYGKRNFRKFLLYGKKGTRACKRLPVLEQQRVLYARGVREVGYQDGQEFVIVPEMVPELIVPDLSGFELKPYVSYRAPDVYQSEFTAQDLFDAVYSSKITEDFKNGKLDDEGNPLNPSHEESLTVEEAYRNSRKTGSDIF